MCPYNCRAARASGMRARRTPVVGLRGEHEQDVRTALGQQTPALCRRAAGAGGTAAALFWEALRRRVPTLLWRHARVGRAPTRVQARAGRASGANAVERERAAAGHATACGSHLPSPTRANAADFFRRAGTARTDRPTARALSSVAAREFIVPAARKFPHRWPEKQTTNTRIFRKVNFRYTSPAFFDPAAARVSNVPMPTFLCRRFVRLLRRPRRRVALLLRRAAALRVFRYRRTARRLPAGPWERRRKIIRYPFCTRFSFACALRHSVRSRRGRIEVSSPPLHTYKRSYYAYRRYRAAVFFSCLRFADVPTARKKLPLKERSEMDFFISQRALFVPIHPLDTETRSRTNWSLEIHSN